MTAKKKRFRVYGAVSASKHLGELEADSAEEAERLAWQMDEADVSVCYHCSGEVEDPEIEEIHVEEIEEQVQS